MAQNKVKKDNKDEVLLDFEQNPPILGDFEEETLSEDEIQQLYREQSGIAVLERQSEVESVDIDPEFQDFVLRLSEALEQRSMVGQLGGWICDNTFLEPEEPFSFKDHEFQIAIANDEHLNQVVQKCSQVGVSELTIRIVLALLALKPMHAIYTLPSAAFASKFCTSRINPVIERSPRLRAQQKAGIKSNSMKRIGNSFLYIAGCANASQAISTPARMVVHDERDFSNQAVLTTYASRLRHQLDGGIRKNFSTPTVEGFGVGKDYVEKSDMKRYLCKCLHCAKWQAVNFATQVVIGGFDRPFRELTKQHLLDPEIEWQNAWIRCDWCGKDLWASLTTAEQREWVAEMPSRLGMSGYAVKPLDLPLYNPVAKILAQLGDYTRLQDFHNFVLGDTFSSHENQIDKMVVMRCTTGAFQAHGSGMCMGVDVGKHWLHVVIGKIVDKRYRIVALAKVRELSNQTMVEGLTLLFRTYGCYIAVIDALPDYTVGKNFRAAVGNVYPAVYVPNSRRKIKSYWVLDETEGNAVIQRTRGIDSMVQEINAGLFEWPKCPEMEEVLEHLQNEKRIEEKDDEDNVTAKWVKVSENDHFFHAAVYFKTACDMQQAAMENDAPPAPVTIGSVTIGSNHALTTVQGLMGTGTRERPGRLQTMLGPYHRR